MVVTHDLTPGTSQHVPRASQTRTVSSGTKLEAVEVPASGASYNPSLEQHQELLWKGKMWDNFCH